MNKSLYKSSFKNINVSDNIIEKLEIKASAHIRAASPGKRKLPKLFLPAAVLLAASIIAVSAAPAIGLDTAFRSFFSQFFGTEISDSQLDIIEKYGYAPDKSFKRSGVELRVDGVIGDSNLLYVKYSVSMEKGYDHYIHSGIVSKNLYIGDLKQGIRPVSITTSSLFEKAASTAYDYAVIYNFNKDTVLEGKNATLVMTFPARYEPVGVDLAKILSKYGAAPVDSKDIYNIPDSKLNIPFKTKYGNILLESFGYAGGNLVLAVDASDYYKIPPLYLRNKKTNRIYTRNDGFTSVDRNNLEIYPFYVDTEKLEELEIIMPEEEYFSFPLNYTDKTRIYDLTNENISINNTKLNKLKLSPLSMTFYGSAPAGHGPDFSSGDCYIRMKDNTVFENIKLREGRSGFESGNFVMNLQFEVPLEIENIDALLIKTVNDYETIEIPLSGSYLSP